MDDSKEATLDELIAKINSIDLSDKTIQGASGSDWLESNTITMTSPSYTMSDLSYGAIPSISISGTSGSMLGHTGQNTVWTTTTTAGNPYTAMGAGSSSGKVVIQGENADIVIGDKSMRNWMEKVEERLNILTPNPELEKEWDDLRRLGERYRKLEKKCKEKADMWKKLKSMPKPNINI